MSLTRTIPLRDYVFARATLAELLKELSGHYRKPKERFSSTWFSFEIAQDATTTTTIDSPPKSFEPLLSAQIERLHLAVHVRDAGRNIDATIRHGGWPYESSIRIYGDDEDWVNLTHGRVAKLLSTVERQNRLVRDYPVLIWAILAFTIGWVLDRGLSWYFITTGQAKLVPFTWSIFGQHLFTSFMLGITPAGIFTDFIRKSFPSIELRLGPPHTWVEARRQRYLLGLLGLLVVGPSGDLIADVFRHLF